MTLEEIQKYYSGLLTAQYRTKPKAIATIELMAKEMSCDDLPRIESTCFDLDTAIGAQLDVIGRIVGLTRNIFGLDLAHSFFAFSRYSTPGGLGFLRYADTPDPLGMFSRYLTTSTFVMSDFEFRSLIRLKIIYNTAPMTFKAVKEALYSAFAGGINITDNLNSTVTYTVEDPYHNTMIVAEYVGNIIPKSMGVAASVTYI